MTFDAFFDRLGDLDWLAVIVGTGAAMVLGWLWFGQLFGKAMSRATGITMPSTPKPGQMLLTAAYLFVFNVGIAVMGVTDDFEHALVAGIIFGALLVGSAMFSGVVWAGHSRTGYWISMLYWVVAVVVAYFVQGLIA